MSSWPIRRSAAKSEGGPAELPDQDRRDRFSVPPALHQVAESRRPCRNRHQEHLPFQLRQCLALSLRKELLENCNLHTVLDCPGGTFLGAGVKTVVLFFEKGAPPKRIWYYQLDPGRNLGKTNPLNDDDLKEFVELQPTFADLKRSLGRSTCRTSMTLRSTSPS